MLIIPRLSFEISSVFSESFVWHMGQEHTFPSFSSVQQSILPVYPHFMHVFHFKKTAIFTTIDIKQAQLTINLFTYKSL